MDAPGAPHGTLSYFVRKLRRYWPLLAGSLMLLGLMLADERGNRQRAEFTELQGEIRALRLLIEHHFEMGGSPQKRNDGRILFA